MGAAPVYVYGEVVNDVLNIARARVDALRALSPSGFPSESDPGGQFNEVGGGTSLSTALNADGTLVLRTQVILNNAWRKFQKYLGNLGYRQLIVDDFVVTAVPVNSSPDPAIQTWISWNGTAWSDGTNFTATPALPADFYAPLKIRERLSGQNAIFAPMRVGLDGLRNQFVRTILNRQWEWRTNALFLPGATALTDLQLRYIRFLPIFTGSTSPVVPWYLQQIPIPGSASALAWYIVYEALFPTGEEPGATEVLVNAETEANLVFNDQARADQRTNNRRRPRGGSARGLGGWRYGG